MPDVMAQIDHPPVRITRLPVRTRLLLRGDADALGAALGVSLPTTPCTAAPGDPAVLWLGPDEWLLLGTEGPPAWDGETGATFDVSDRQIALLVEGDRAVDALAAGCPLDLAGRPVDFCTRTVFGKAEIVLWRRDTESWHVETWRSFAPYVEALLAEAARTV